jgi:hypothetical protein
LTAASLQELSNYVQLYRARWKVELFFRWIKQHLRIKAFYGTSENVVKTQAWVALSIYVLVAIVKKQLGLDLSLYKILQILSVTVFEKKPNFRGGFQLQRWVHGCRNLQPIEPIRLLMGQH